MSPWDFIDALTPHARVTTALAPFLMALIARLIFGKNRLTRAVLSLSTMWFAINVLLAPFSVSLRQELLHLPFRFR
ncbi:MAG: hypothetical protein C5B51_07575 [Terriglobia bacterium]|nr:MAG: hypothetical protein C5B51_07575 [Terriglobia bacterium]